MTLDELKALAKISISYQGKLDAVEDYAKNELFENHLPFTDGNIDSVMEKYCRFYL